jgi:mono/diheme cytochrome c family protein
MKRIILIHSLLVLLLLGFTACGGSESDPSSEATSSTSSTEADGLSEAELENGIGPIKSVTLNDKIDEELEERGEEIFKSKCAACHKLEERYVGPPLGTVLSRRTPAFVMNMILNPDEMVKKHPEVQAMLAQFMTPMPNQNLTEEEARAVLEYLRDHQEEAEEDEEETEDQ